jgi:8-oxo-dGTP diphosphatase
MSKTQTAYTIGFFFYAPTDNPAGHELLLVRKTKPDWQRYLWNGVGGKVEPNETPHNCMRREFWEETKLQTQDWQRFAVESGPGYLLHCFRAFFKPAKPIVPMFNDAQEPLGWHSLASLDTLPVVGNLRWLIPLALDWRDVSAMISTGDTIVEKPSW